MTCSFELPYADQFIPVSIKTNQAGSIHYRFTAKGMTACPCSKKMIGVGHMQRAEIIMMVETRKPVDMLKLIDKMEECFSAIPTEKMKRIEEAKKILEAQDHARFAEDLVRECARRFPNSVYITRRGASSRSMPTTRSRRGRRRAAGSPSSSLSSASDGSTGVGYAC